ncbi:GTP-binding protein [Devosia sp. Root413D1]|uniref:elongation factor G n=1 Tax=Devosia sp. Root413D1 TaxID=1736531 RepID=UPI00070028A5|nr:TetM/TetW/TetO/TetS family tetracycline resistance ribosomal protection protein [Devosia sp. Root413D1]KQW79161.1 GTP-binding protein [Devosia sp. Root413D1]
MRTLNLGILAHVDAGKTSLTERLLYAAGVIDRLGSVDGGNTQTDTMALERQRGITIKAAVVSFVAHDTTINLIDTPGHPDFIAEVERVLNVLDGAVLVVSAVEGVQGQTRVLMRALQRLRIPTLIFINKLDRAGADPDRVLATIRRRLTPDIVPMGMGQGLGTAAAAFAPFGPDDKTFRDTLAECLAEHDEAVLAAYVDNRHLPYHRLRGALAQQSRAGRLHPVFMGSAISGAGVETLLSGIAELLPAPSAELEAPPSGRVFKVDRGPAGEKLAYVRMFAGALHNRERLQLRGEDAKITGVEVFERGAVVRRDRVVAGEIARLRGLDVRIGDSIGISPRPAAQHFAPPTLETLVVPVAAADRRALWTVLGQLAEQDPLINLRKDDTRQEIFVSLYGEVQKEVIEATLLTDYGLAVAFRETTMICVERPLGTGTAIEQIFKPPNPFLATVGIRVAPGPVGSGLDIRLEAMFGAMPVAFYEAIEAAIGETLRQGLMGWQVTDAIVSVTDAGHKAPMSAAGDFRNLTPLVLMEALRLAGTAVCEPIHNFLIDVPAEALAAALSVLARLDALPGQPVLEGVSYVVEGEIAAARVHELQQLLPGLTHGEGALETSFAGYRAVAGPVPTRRRSDNNPLNRKEYLLHVLRRVPTSVGET